MLYSFRLNKMVLLAVIPLSILYLVGGFFQYLGILTATQSNFVILFLLCFIFTFYSAWMKLKLEWPILCILIMVIITQIVRSPPLNYSLTYVYYTLCVIVGAVSGRFYASKFFDHLGEQSFEVLFRLVKIFLLIQVIVTIFQASFTQAFIDLSSAPIGYEDAIFGTLFLQSDAVLAAICQMLMILSFALPCSYRDRFKIVLYSLVVVFLGNSKASQAIIFIVFSILLFKNMGGLKKAYKIAFGYLFALAIIAIIAIFHSYILQSVFDFIELLKEDFYKINQWVTAPRFAPLGEILMSGLDWFGRGPLTYYNPIEKTWLYNSGFSTIYVLYFDYGLIAISLYLYYQFSLIFKFTKSMVERFLFSLVFFTYINFNISLTDIGFMFFFNFSLYLIYRFRSNQDTMCNRRLL